MGEETFVAVLDKSLQDDEVAVHAYSVILHPGCCLSQGAMRTDIAKLSHKIVRLIIDRGARGLRRNEVAVSRTNYEMRSYGKIPLSRLSLKRFPK
jgi:hypothetical protein